VVRPLHFLFAGDPASPDRIKLGLRHWKKRTVFPKSAEFSTRGGWATETKKKRRREKVNKVRNPG